MAALSMVVGGDPDHVKQQNPAGSAALPLVSLTGIVKRYVEHTVLDRVSLEVPAGNVLGIIGPSGSGKSTLLRCINFLEMPNEGQVVLDNIRITAGTRILKRDLLAIRRAAGMVFQSFNLFPHMTVLRNVSLAQEKVLGRSRQEADERSMELLSRVGLATKAHQYPAKCSGGQQQRAAIARALALNPKVMLFDEPTSALDPEVGLEVLAVMRELAESGMTMIIVTHEMHFAETVSDSIIMMAEGMIVESGPAREVMRSPRTERAQRFLRAVKDR